MRAPRYRFMLVEDERDHVDLVRNLLSEAWPDEHACIVKESLAEAVKCLDETPQYDLMLLDLRLKDSAGLETLRRVLNRSPPYPIVVLTSINDVELGARAVTEGAQDYLVKSEMTPALLQKTLRYSIERYRYSAELERRNRELLHFAQLVAHEIRNPLSAISSGTDALQSGELEHAESRGILSLMSEQVQEISDFIEDMLRFSSSSASEDSDEQADGNACLRAALADLREDIEQRGVRITVDPLPAFQVKRMHLQHLFYNLVGNAVRHGRSRDATVHVSHARDPRSALDTVSVRDNGPGIAPEDHERVFSMFARAGQNKNPLGSGIGLAFCRRVVKSYGGTLWVESVPGEGSTFCFSLPALSRRDAVGD